MLMQIVLVKYSEIKADLFYINATQEENLKRIRYIHLGLHH